MSVICSTSIRYNQSLENALSIIRRLGFKEVDLLLITGWAHIDIPDLVNDFDSCNRRIEALLTKYDLKPVAVNAKYSVDTYDRSAEAIKQRERETYSLIRFMKYYGIEVASIQPTLKFNDEFLSGKFKDTVETLKEQKEIAYTEGVKIAIEPHIGSGFDTIEKVYNLMREIPDVPITYDPSHFIQKGENLYETEFMLNNTVHVHLRDASKTSIMNLFGQGIIDFDWIVQKLKDKKYKGYISIEYLPQKDFTEEELFEDIVRIREYLEKAFYSEK
ncbi:sugar phosphate isomerase/epimerase [Caldicoprobacter algeriensis]|uniref:sugar phosphate isomerase/epimerase family protein n=1 Tax=Caldicoprobacter algeriensis TaxID=699281 RepID=UPI002079934B|nr:sugar phosphate isomerase/epimerase [Caldicoprobacter algeriensis]MCM8900081.1 sugar phosphate isomerase/epimerase [Caldicoprobacter algeriensis]